jgi:hypothetical protein
VDPGISVPHSSHVVHRLGLVVQAYPAVTVIMANGETMMSDTMVKGLEWWAGAQFFHTDMRVLPLSAFDAILGYDLLRHHSPMECGWVQKILQFMVEGRQVVLLGDEEVGVGRIQQVTGSQVHKWTKGNDIWACVVLEEVVEKLEEQHQGDIQKLVHEFGMCLKFQICNLLLGCMIIIFL